MLVYYEIHTTYLEAARHRRSIVWVENSSKDDFFYINGGP